MAAALMFFSIGTPMVTEGLDFLKSKYGENDTYLEATSMLSTSPLLDIHRNTHNYFKIGFNSDNPLGVIAFA